MQHGDVVTFRRAGPLTMGWLVERFGTLAVVEVMGSREVAYLRDRALGTLRRHEDQGMRRDVSCAPVDVTNEYT